MPSRTTSAKATHATREVDLIALDEVLAVSRATVDRDCARTWLYQRVAVAPNSV